MTDPVKPNWIQIEVDYRAGVKTLRQIAEEHGITHGAVNKRAKAQGWERDLSAKIRAQADAKVSKAVVSKEVAKERADTEKAVVEANAELQAQARLGHRKDIGRGRTMFSSLMNELEAETTDLELFERLGEMLDQTRTDDNGREIKDKLNEIYRKVISTPGRVDSFKKLTETLEKLIRLEREALGITDDGGKGDEADDLWKRLAKEAEG